MKLTTYHKRIFDGHICPYCKKKTKIVRASTIYNNPKLIENVVVCSNYPNCYSFTNCKPGRLFSEGRLANAELHNERKDAIEAFDKLWLKRYDTKSNLKRELMEFLNVPKGYEEIYFFNIKTCQKVVSWSIRKLLHFTYDPNKPFIVKMVNRKRIIVIKEHQDFVTIEYDDGKRANIPKQKIMWFNPKPKKKN